MAQVYLPARERMDFAARASIFTDNDYIQRTETSMTVRKYTNEYEEETGALASNVAT